MTGANLAVGETSGTAGGRIRNVVPTSCSPRLLLVHWKLDVRSASALCSPSVSGSSSEVVSKGGVLCSVYCFLVSTLRLLIPVYLLREVLLGGIFPVKPSACAPILVGLPGSLGSNCQHPS